MNLSNENQMLGYMLWAVIIYALVSLSQSQAAMYQPERGTTLANTYGPGDANNFISKLAKEHINSTPNDLCKNSGLFTEDSDLIPTYSFTECLQNAEASLKKAKQDIADEAERVRYEEDYRVKQKQETQKAQDDINLERIEIINQTPEQAKARKAYLLQELKLRSYPYLR